jgi:hypothetical protein
MASAALPLRVTIGLEAARGIGQAATLMHALVHCSWPCAWTGNDVAAEGLLREAIALAEETGASSWKGRGVALLGCVLEAPGPLQLRIGIATGLVVVVQTRRRSDRRPSSPRVHGG